MKQSILSNKTQNQ